VANETFGALEFVADVFAPPFSNPAAFKRVCAGSTMLSAFLITGLDSAEVIASATLSLAVLNMLETDENKLSDI
jgi:hypothetical protein